MVYDYLKIGDTKFYPASVTWGEQDVSAPEAGRTLDAVMHKMLVARKVKLTVSWQNVDEYEAKKILNAVRQETFNVTYHDPLTMKMTTKTMYVGDRSAAVYTWCDDIGTIYSNINYDLIEV